jgi:hypothetical protein
MENVPVIKIKIDRKYTSESVPNSGINPILYKINGVAWKTPMTMRLNNRIVLFSKIFTSFGTKNQLTIVEKK